MLMNCLFTAFFCRQIPCCAERKFFGMQGTLRNCPCLYCVVAKMGDISNGKINQAGRRRARHCLRGKHEILSKPQITQNLFNYQSMREVARV